MSDRTGPWKCFHCDEVFETVECAVLHFGVDQMQVPACVMDIEHVRSLEREIQQWRDESMPLQQEIRALEAKNSVDVRRAEELGYARGLRDAHLLEQE